MGSTRRRAHAQGVVRVLRRGAGSARAASAAADTGEARLAVAWLRVGLGIGLGGFGCSGVRVFGC